MTETPWSRLEMLRQEAKSLRDRLRNLAAEEETLIKECQDWLYSGPLSLLTPHEAQLLSLLQDEPAMLNKELASKLNVSERTVKFHLRNMFAKFKVPGKTKLLLAVAKKSTGSRKCVKVVED